VITPRDEYASSRCRWKTATVYLAGPFFDIGQRWLVEEANDYLLEMGANVFSPVHEVGPGPADIVAPEDIKGLERSDVVFAILNGMDPGTIFEVGYAVKKGIPVVGLAQNVRLEDLKMMEGTGCEIHSDFASAIYRAIWALPA
jgi:nucleoside 2-deoxyribosyltransferase